MVYRMHPSSKSLTSGLFNGHGQFRVTSAQAVRAFTLPPPAAAAHVSAIHRLSGACGEGAWAGVLQKDCEERLGHYVDAASKGTLASDSAKAEWQACTAAFTAGEASACPFAYIIGSIAAGSGYHLLSISVCTASKLSFLELQQS